MYCVCLCYSNIADQCKAIVADNELTDVIEVCRYHEQNYVLLTIFHVYCIIPYTILNPESYTVLYSIYVIYTHVI